MEHGATTIPSTLKEPLAKGAVKSSSVINVGSHRFESVDVNARLNLQVFQTGLSDDQMGLHPQFRKDFEDFNAVNHTGSARDPNDDTIHLRSSPLQTFLKGLDHGQGKLRIVDICVHFYNLDPRV